MEGYSIFERRWAKLKLEIGRAARHINGKAILYADQVTGSMQRAIEETNRRREKQVTFNEEHGITPRSVIKKVADIMEGAYPGAPVKAKQYAKVAQEMAEYASLTPSQMMKKVKELEKQMYKHAENLEFEEAAKVRDKLRHLRGEGLVA